MKSLKTQHLNGFILVDKPASITSRQCVDQVQKVFKGVKAGHSGTLDPFATGLLPICVGRTTKFVDFLRTAQKTYTATLMLGVGTNTQDLTGDIIEEKEIDPFLTEEAILQVFKRFLGKIQQIPPMFSALKINGNRLYSLARKKIEVDRKPRQIHIHKLDLLGFDNPQIHFSVTCSEGTYIRTLGVDIAQQLGTTGMLTALRRTKIGRFTVDQAISLDDLGRLAAKNSLFEALYPTKVLTEHLPVRIIGLNGITKFKNGAPLKTHDFIDWKDFVENYQLFNVFTQSDEFLGLAEHMRRDNSVDSVLKMERLADIW